MEENNRKGPGIFYAVVGVATLVVAIIGATFAFFSASATNNNVITGNTASAGGVSLDVTPITQTGTDMIPLSVITGQSEDDETEDQFGKAMTAKCVDMNGNNVCQVYKIVVTNLSTTSNITIRGTLALESSAANMYWKLITATDTEGALASGSVFADATNVKCAADIDTNDDGVADAGVGNLTVLGNSIPTLGGTQGTGAGVSSHVLGYEEPNNSKTYYVLVWLEETGIPQEKEDAAQNFKGHVFFSAVDAIGNSTGITATFAS